jgi:hypothetical protein
VAALKARAATGPSSTALRFQGRVIKCALSDSFELQSVQLGYDDPLCPVPEFSQRQLALRVPVGGRVAAVRANVTVDGAIGALTFYTTSPWGDVVFTCGTGRGASVDLMPRNAALAALRLAGDGDGCRGGGALAAGNLKLESERLAQQREHDDDAREAGHHQQQCGQKGQRSQQQKGLQAQTVILAAAGRRRAGQRRQRVLRERRRRKQRGGEREQARAGRQAGVSCHCVFP